MDGGSAGAAGSGSSKNLEGLYIGLFSAYRQAKDCRNGDSFQLLVYIDESRVWEPAQKKWRKKWKLHPGLFIPR